MTRRGAGADAGHAGWTGRLTVRFRVRDLMFLLLLLSSATLALGCVERGGETRVFVDGTQVSSPVASATATPASAATVPALAFTPTPYTSDLDPADLTDFIYPIVGACLPSRDEVMPNAPRIYRNGVHEGVDLYNGDVCTPVALGTEVLAMHAGVVIRADLDYVDITAAQVETLTARTNAQGFSDPEAVDLYRGRQVWIDHGNGVRSRYGHLSAITAGIDVGVEVSAGRAVGAVGESGTPESLTAPGTELHLHVEVRAGERFLGEGLAPDEVRRLYFRLFSGAAEPAATGTSSDAGAGATRAAD